MNISTEESKGRFNEVNKMKLIMITIIMMEFLLNLIIIKMIIGLIMMK